MTYQLTAPLLDACVLGIIAQEDSYGYTLTQRVQGVVDISGIDSLSGAQKITEGESADNL